MGRDTEQAEKLDLRDYLAPVWRYKWIILSLALTVAVATYAIYSGKPEMYGASTDIYLGASGVDELVTGTEQTGSERELANQARVLRSRPVALRVAHETRLGNDPEQLLDALEVIPDLEADFVTVNTVWSDPEDAARLANAFAQAFLDQRLATRRDEAGVALEAAQRALAELGSDPTRSDERAALSARISQLEILQSLPSGPATRLDRARPAMVAIGPRPQRNAIFAFVLTIAFGILAAYGIDRVDRRIRKLEEVTPIYDAPVLGTIPRAAEAMSHDAPRVTPASLREPFRTLRTSLEMAGVDAGAVLITSGVPGEGKSTIVRNLAMTYRESGKQVAIVEADLRRPTAAGWLGTPDGPGLTQVLLGEARLDDALHEVSCQATVAPPPHRASVGQNGSGASGHSANGDSFEVVSSFVPAGLFLLPGGSAAVDPPALMGTGRLRQVLAQLTERFDIVLVDTPPLLSVSDALPMLSEVVGTLVVSRVGTTTEKSAQQVVELVGRVRDARLLGVIANDVPLTSLPASYAYSDYGLTG